MGFRLTLLPGDERDRGSNLEHAEAVPGAVGVGMLCPQGETGPAAGEGDCAVPQPSDSTSKYPFKTKKLEIKKKKLWEENHPSSFLLCCPQPVSLS